MKPRRARTVTAAATGMALALAGLVPVSSCRTFGAEAPVSDGGSDATFDAFGFDADAGTDSRAEPPVVLTVDGSVVVDTFLGGATRGNTDGVGPAAELDDPVGLALAVGGDLFVTELGAHRVRRASDGGQTAIAFAGFTRPVAIAAASADLVFVSDDSGAIWRLSAGNAEVLVSGLGKIRGLAVLGNGKLALVDADRHTITLLDPGTKTLTPLAGKQGEAGFVDALGESARFRAPAGCATLPDGAIVVADQGNNVLRRVTLDGDTSTFAGDGLPGMKDGPDRLRARFDGPVDVATDPLGAVFVSDVANARIRRVDNAGVVQTIAGDGTHGFVDGAGAAARFFAQTGIELAVDGKTLFVSDGNREDATQPYNRVRRIVLP